MNFFDDDGDLDSSFSYEDYFNDHEIPRCGCSLEFCLNSQLIESVIQISDAASWEIPELLVRQENFAHAGYNGTIAGLLKKVDKDVEMMRSGYSANLQDKIEEFLCQIRLLAAGEVVHEGAGAYHILVRDPSGISRIITDEATLTDSASLIKFSHFERDFFENDSIGLVTDLTTIFSPEKQLKDPVDVAQLVLKSSRIVCLSGAGISVESGIPPFRTINPTDDNSSQPSSVAIWREFDPNLMTVQGFNSNPAIAEEWWRMKHSLLPRILSAQPNSAHLFFSYLESVNKLNAIVTQNIDSLHSRAGVSSDRVIELHGHMRGVICSNNSSSKYNPVPYRDGLCAYSCSEEDCLKKNYFETESCPLCPDCQSPLRTETVMFGQPIAPEDYRRAIQEISDCDLLFIIGSSLIVHPANSLPMIAQKMGIPIVMVNMDETSYDIYATGLVNQPAGQFFKEVTDCLREMLS
jgi:NAD-dependent deacetylase